MNEMSSVHRDLAVVVLRLVQEAEQQLAEVQLLRQRVLLDSVRAERGMRDLVGCLPLGVTWKKGRELRQMSKEHSSQVPVRD
jgi:hypothetical protein